jgi:short-subunit dehydrogenase
MEALTAFVPRWLLVVVAAGVALAAVSYVRRRMRVSARRARMRNTVAVVTGASSGIGRCIALELARRGCHVLLVARTKATLDAVAGECASAGAASATVCPCDVTVAADVTRLAEAARALPGRPALGVLVLNAGRGGICDFDESDDSERIARDLMEVNYFANLNIVRRMLPQIKADRADILVVSSLSGLIATPQRTQYSASKFAVQGFFNALRLELQPLGCHVAVACPGFVKTEFHARVLTTAAAGGPPERKGAFMTAEECAALSVEGLESGAAEVPMTLKGFAGYALRPLLPWLIDALAVREAKKSIK